MYIKVIYTCFTNIINGFKSLRMTYPNVDLVNKILRSLPKSQEPKVNAIQKVKDLKTLPLNRLVGSLFTIR